MNCTLAKFVDLILRLVFIGNNADLKQERFIRDAQLRNQGAPRNFPIIGSSNQEALINKQ